MSWEREVISEAPERLAERNSATLLAVQLQTQVKRYLDAIEAHAVELQSLRSSLTDAQRIGIEVLRAHRKGRKTVRIESLVR